ncbi:hypothetical protein KC332_g17270 [Hortaea werneckii]|uniref:C3H1-type domain-containing protein n=2 Tax=Hortaea werneckii TaxID=91943 RepID=A0A3M7I1N3_HORWE|nr:hypothetical protein KC358_g17432 [Hortaea werneckii]OTA27701.1 hypothetical protein BTJ68_09466 [Hortaea werneckii EXF-2000]KAI6793670.1 hypothetical protein KC350_g17351 [Hortaea werneckii]KAI6898756.1 hypothetical protein KC348_g17345 [Hortaea werneckii]KAI6919327.1 hypothetical protein KC341_g17380 [Hortaea werneckii]
MFSEQQLHQSAGHLADFRHNDIQHRESLAALLDDYAVLIDQYNRLRSDYEEERDARERYKQMARGQERDPFVLVLVDGDGYVFNDDFVSRGAEGGQKAAQLLKDNINRSLRWKGLEGCQIMVRVYANLVGLSKALAKEGLAGKEKRSLANFAASFTQSNDLFDYVDAGESENSASFKIRAMFRQSVNNSQCKHIFFAGCHDTRYISELAPYSSERERITLVGSGTFHHEFVKIGPRIENFPMLFRPTSLKRDPVPQKSTTEEVAPPLTKSTPTAQPAENANNGEGKTPKVCGFFKKGKCKNGKNCRFLHTQDSSNGSTEITNAKTNDSKVEREEPSNEKTSTPFHLSNLNQTDNDFMNGHTPSPAQQTSTPVSHPAQAKSQDPLQNLFDFATGLPQPSSVPAGKVPVNKAGDRLDTYIDPPSPYDLEQFKARTKIQKLCNDHHLAGSCAKGDTCPFDHAPISDGVCNALKQVAYGVLCPRKSGCRRPVCQKGHCCQRTDCRHRGGKFPCKIPRGLHSVDMNLAGFVDGVEGSAPGMGAQQGSVELGGGNASGGVRVDGMDGETSSFEHGTLISSLRPGVDRSIDGVSSPHLTTNNGLSHPGLEPGYDSWDPTPQPAQAGRDAASGWDDPRPAPMAQPATEGWDSVRPTMAVDYGLDAPRPVVPGDEW